ncbi:MULTISPECIES: NF038215 family lipoprotein [Acinetobacter]|uniref:NF038215 family lipoprotein n=1 Tax=Acinetobacter nematophilus TaxID=2994642 RepID=A0A9X3IHY7_9GAMM|nr:MULTISPECIES: NF038215 family lipoprotein [Acinetobacter]MBJ9952523.1 NF038215 family lipoprotein [Acinetobacter baumannii]MCX5469478.1 NF038215 family lipoprotein [Acinetobacter nematophilus]
MKKLSVGLSVILVAFLVGCEKKPPTPTKTEVRSIHIAGMPVYEKDYRLTARDTSSELQP